MNKNILLSKKINEKLENNDLSLIVPVLENGNQENSLLWDSLFQIEGNVEIIIIFNGEFNKNKRNIQKYTKRDTRIKTYFFHKEEKLGIVLNKILNTLKGKYFALFNYKQPFENSIFEEMRKKITLTGADVVCTLSEKQQKILNKTNSQILCKIQDEDIYIQEDNLEDFFTAFFDISQQYLFRNDFIKFNNIHFQTLNEFCIHCFIGMAISSAEKIAYIPSKKIMNEETPLKFKNQLNQSFLWYELFESYSFLANYLKRKGRYFQLEKSFLNNMLMMVFDNYNQSKEPIKSFIAMKLITESDAQFNLFRRINRNFYSALLTNFLSDLLKIKNYSFKLLELYRKKSSKIYPIVYFAEFENDIKFIGVSIESLKRYFTDENFYDIYVICAPRVSRKKSYELEIQSLSNYRVTCINIENEVYEKVKDKGITFLSFYLLNYIEGYARMLYLDKFSILRTDIASFFSSNDEKFLLAFPFYNKKLNFEKTNYFPDIMMLDFLLLDELDIKTDLFNIVLNKKISVMDDILNLVPKNLVRNISLLWSYRVVLGEPLFQNNNESEIICYENANLLIYSDTIIKNNLYPVNIWWENARKSFFYEELLCNIVKQLNENKKIQKDVKEFQPSKINQVSEIKKEKFQDIEKYQTKFIKSAFLYFFTIGKTKQEYLEEAKSILGKMKGIL